MSDGKSIAFVELPDRAAGAWRRSTTESNDSGFSFSQEHRIRALRVNLSKTGVSLTAGVPGAHVNFDLSGRREHPVATLGLPGTGLSYRTTVARWLGLALGAAVLLIALAAFLAR